MYIYMYIYIPRVPGVWSHGRDPPRRDPHPPTSGHHPPETITGVGEGVWVGGAGGCRGSPRW